MRLLIAITGAMLAAGEGKHRQSYRETVAAEHIRALTPGERELALHIVAHKVAALACLGEYAAARAVLDDLDERQSTDQVVCNAVAVLRLAEDDPAGAREALAAGSGPAHHIPTRVMAHVLEALAGRGLGDEQTAHDAMSLALREAQPDRLMLPFVLTRAGKLLRTLNPHVTSGVSLAAEILGGTGETQPLPSRTPTVSDSPLSLTELRVLRHLPTNLSRTEIATELAVSVNTVSTHIRSIYTKLGVVDRASAVRVARERRLLAAGVP